MNLSLQEAVSRVNAFHADRLRQAAALLQEATLDAPEGESADGDEGLYQAHINPPEPTMPPPEPPQVPPGPPPIGDPMPVPPPEVDPPAQPQ